MIVCPFYLEGHRGVLSRRWRTTVVARRAAAAPIRHRRGPQQVDINNYTSAAGGAIAAEIRVLPFHDYKRRLLASPGAMAIPDRRGSAVLIGLPQKQMLRRRADAGPPRI